MQVADSTHTQVFGGGKDYVAISASPISVVQASTFVWAEKHGGELKLSRNGNWMRPQGGGG